MTIHFQDDQVTVHHGDALDVLREMPDASVDAVVTDPPYGLAELPAHVVTAALAAWLAGDREHVPDGKGFMGRDWDRFVPPPALWDECFRVLKPGGHLLAFAAPRTTDLMTLSIRLAGFEVRDSIFWAFGQGFPKSLDVAKAIDKARDDRADVNRVTGWLAEQRDQAGLTNRDIDNAFGFNGMAGHWTAAPHLKIAHVPQWEQWLRLRDLIGFGEEMDAEVWRLNGRKGTPGEAWSEREVVGVRNGGSSAGRMVGPLGIAGGAYEVTKAATSAAATYEGWGTALKPAQEPITVARKPLIGTVAANVLAHGTGALNIDACRIEASGRPLVTSNRSSGNNTYGDGLYGSRATGTTDTGRWPTNVVFAHAGNEADGDLCADGCVPGCPIAELDVQSGERGRNGSIRNAGPRRNDVYGADARDRGNWTAYDDSGGASRYFPTFRFEAKAPTSERPKVDGTAHATVKPLALMQWLVRLVTPPGGVCLDPFAGSGTTAEACIAEGFRCITVEREAEYLPLIMARLSKPIQLDLFGFGEAS